jgi:hypothetical protein
MKRLELHAKPYRWQLHLIVARRFACDRDYENYTCGSVATGTASLIAHVKRVGVRRTETAYRSEGSEVPTPQPDPPRAAIMMQERGHFCFSGSLHGNSEENNEDRPHP